MTFPEYIKELQRQTANIQSLEAAAARAIFDAHNKHMNSIFLGMEGTRYSTRPTLAGSNVAGNLNKFGGQSYSFVTRAGSNKYFSKEALKSQRWVTKDTPRGRRNLIVIPGGYAELRRADGRQTLKVDLRRQGILERDYRSSLTKTDFGWVSGLRREENFKKWEGAQARYGDKVLVSQEIQDGLVANLAENYLKFATS